MRVCQLAVTMEVRQREAGLEASVDLARRLSGSVLDPSLVTSWSRFAAEAIGRVDERSPWEGVVAAEPPQRGPLAQHELDEALQVIADYADLKSPWFSGRSRGVAELVTAAARHAGRSEADVTTVRRAALLHDLGRNGVPNTVWDKPGPLTDPEHERMRLHAYYTDRVVRRSGALARLAPIASAAQEREDGSGYPRGLSGDTIPLLGRLLAAADVYHAMLEPRPHRPASSREAAARELRDMVRAGRLHGPSVDAVLAAAGHRGRRKPTAPAGLTAREVEVLGLVARGATLREVGARLGIAAKTAGNHVERIYAKAGVSSRAEAAMFAMQHGLLTP
jgi:HD-GYP domain-containing protein (c-di-GMP phosphodiesterase class II)